MKASIMEGLDVRIALEMSESVAYKILDYDNTKVIKELQNSKDKRMFVYNKSLGMLGNNVVGNIIHLKQEEIQPTLSKIINKLDKHLVLQPILVKSEEKKEEEVVEVKERAKSTYESKYGTSGEDDGLSRLEKMGFTPNYGGVE